MYWKRDAAVQWLPQLSPPPTCQHPRSSACLTPRAALSLPASSWWLRVTWIFHVGWRAKSRLLWALCLIVTAAGNLENGFHVVWRKMARHFPPAGVWHTWFIHGVCCLFITIFVWVSPTLIFFFFFVRWRVWGVGSVWSAALRAVCKVIRAEGRMKEKGEKS